MYISIYAYTHIHTQKNASAVNSCPRLQGAAASHRGGNERGPRSPGARGAAHEDHGAAPLRAAASGARTPADSSPRTARLRPSGPRSCDRLAAQELRGVCATSERSRPRRDASAPREPGAGRATHETVGQRRATWRGEGTEAPGLGRRRGATPSPVWEGDGSPGPR